MWFRDLLIIASCAFVDFLLCYALRLHPPFSCMSLFNFSLHYVSTPDPCWVWVVGGYLSSMCPPACARWDLVLPGSCQSFRRLLSFVTLLWPFGISLWKGLSWFWFLNFTCLWPPVWGLSSKNYEIIPNCELCCLLVGASLQKSQVLCVLQTHICYLPTISQPFISLLPV